LVQNEDLQKKNGTLKVVEVNQTSKKGEEGNQMAKEEDYQKWMETNQNLKEKAEDYLKVKVGVTNSHREEEVNYLMLGVGEVNLLREEVG
jgi:beta-N-acetylglucosaminidase